MADNSLKKGRYTKYSNKIGLFSNSKGSFIKNDTEVVLNFPFKDTVLEAGMTKEDKGREERFLQIDIDSKDIDTLEEPKVLTDFRYVDKDGERSLTASSDISFFDEDGELKQNLLIKGNNLLALHTLKSRLAGKVKLIYIDPPYNTGGDGFKYNDQFNHSAWLTFMKNRLEASRDLLSDDGNIVVQIDWNEGHYLKVLMDEVFGRENFLNEIVWHYEKWTANSNNLQKNHDNILVYSKNKGQHKFNVVKEITENLKGKYEKGYLLGGGGGSSGLVVYDRTKPNVQKMIDSGKYKVVYQEMDGKPLSDVWKIPFINPVASERTGFNSQKPEKLIERIIKIFTDEGDIVLDYHLGSGTTSAVAHKMGCRWVGIEQMDYIEDVAKERLKKVVEGEQGGISKSVDWSGGGSFVYFELKKYNQEYIDRIMEATSLKELEDIYVDMRNNAFLKFWFDRSHFEKDEDFRQLDLDGRKEALADVLDENQLYLNYADMGDTRHKVTADEKALTDKFYGTNEN